MAKKKTEQEPKSPKVVKRVFKPERCTSHKFIVETDGRVDMAASHEVTDESICMNCGLYFSTWTWYSDAINKAFFRGVDNEAQEIIEYIEGNLEQTNDEVVRGWAIALVDKLRTRRKKNGKRIQVFERTDS